MVTGTRWSQCDRDRPPPLRTERTRKARATTQMTYCRAMQSQERPTPLRTFVLLFLPLVVLLVVTGPAYFGSPIFEVGDFAANALQIEHAKHLSEWLGNYSRFGFHHPGPAFFYVYAIGDLVFRDLLHLVQAPANAYLLGWSPAPGRVLRLGSGNPGQHRSGESNHVPVGFPCHRSRVRPADGEPRVRHLAALPDRHTVRVFSVGLDRARAGLDGVTPDRRVVWRVPRPRTCGPGPLCPADLRHRVWVLGCCLQARSRTWLDALHPSQCSAASVVRDRGLTVRLHIGA